MMLMDLLLTLAAVLLLLTTVMAIVLRGGRCPSRRRLNVIACWHKYLVCVRGMGLVLIVVTIVIRPYYTIFTTAIRAT